jgi:hypothetical protein
MVITYQAAPIVGPLQGRTDLMVLEDAPQTRFVYVRSAVDPDGASSDLESARGGLGRTRSFHVITGLQSQQTSWFQSRVITQGLNQSTLTRLLLVVRPRDCSSSSWAYQFCIAKSELSLRW